MSKDPFKKAVPDPYESNGANQRNRNQGLVPYNARRIWCDLHRTSTHDNADCREQMNGNPSYPSRRPFVPRPHYGRPPSVDTNMIGSMVQREVMHHLSSMANLNGNGKRPAQNHQPADYVQRGAPGTQHSNAYRIEMHCFYCGKGDHYMGTCPKKRQDDERTMVAAGWRPQGSTALAIMAPSSSSDSQPQTVHYVSNAMPNSSPYADSNARDIGPQPKLH
ncbi:hypothetical protein EDC01DRAFT_626189 [Geopyxis carbonaria]|nr:hypothetical protein EDC01DRAFT_630808 [Geopyxis carbonaria]KAI5806089.1 hypothetical protein EDC01DRAFT_626189 [Geopyxis carbonaria]